MFGWIGSNLKLLFKRPTRYQVAALCCRQGEDGNEILLITSRRKKKWIIPKGWPMGDRSDAQSALQEAYEEAGIVGEVASDPIGSYQTAKRVGDDFQTPVEVYVYVVKVSKQENDYLEAGQRETKWVSVGQALEQLDNPNLVYLLKKTHPDNLLTN